MTTRSQRKTPSPGTAVRPPDRPVLVLAALGVAVTAYLSWVAISGQSIALCTEGSGCDIVQNSRWARLLGLPMATWGLGLYALILLTAWLPASPLKRWRRLASLAMIGVAISLYLTAVGLWALDAVCAWCLTSTALMLLTLLVVLVRRPASAPGGSWTAWFLNAALIGLIAAGAVHAWQTDLLRPENPRLRALAEHLDRSDARFYGTFWCPACQQQKRLFGPAAARLPYFECSPSGRTGAIAMECLAQDIRGYPTWIISGRRFQQVLEPQQLARHSGFDWDGYGRE